MARITGTNGADVIWGTSASDTIHGSGGRDTVFGLAGSDQIWGGSANDILWGGDGNDVLRGDGGNDQLHGDAGNDRLVGGAGGDTYWGGAGADTFVFDQVGISNPEIMPETIVDFSRREGDLIDLRAIDANVTKAGDQAFVFIGTDVAFSGRPGELRMIGDPYLLQGDVNGDRIADLQIRFISNPEIVPASLLL